MSEVVEQLLKSLVGRPVAIVTLRVERGLNGFVAWVYIATTRVATRSRVARRMRCWTVMTLLRDRPVACSIVVGLNRVMAMISLGGAVGWSWLTIVRLDGVMAVISVGVIGWGWLTIVRLNGVMTKVVSHWLAVSTGVVVRSDVVVSVIDMMIFADNSDAMMSVIIMIVFAVMSVVVVIMVLVVMMMFVIVVMWILLDFLRFKLASFLVVVKVMTSVTFMILVMGLTSESTILITIVFIVVMT